MRHSKTFTETASRLVLGAISLCLLMFFAGCGTTQPTARSVQTKREYPPASLLTRPAVADFPTEATNGELLTLARTWRNQALECGRDKAAIEEWAKNGAKLESEK